MYVVVCACVQGGCECVCFVYRKTLFVIVRFVTVFTFY